MPRPRSAPGPVGPVRPSLAASEGAREALRELLGGEPLRVVRSAEGYRLEGAIEVRTGALDGERRYGQVAGAGFEPATCGL